MRPQRSYAATIAAEKRAAAADDQVEVLDEDPSTEEQAVNDRDGTD